MVEMKRNKTSANFLILLSVIVLIVYSIPKVEARINYSIKATAPVPSPSDDYRNASAPSASDDYPTAPAPLPPGDYYPTSRSKIFNILSFGARGNGVSDDSKALIAAWKAACKFSGTTLMIPSPFKFLIKRIILRGPCKPNLILQMDGTLLAPRRGRSWPKSSWAWINFKLVEDFKIIGRGVFDGQGFDWWKSKTTPKIKPAALKFAYCNNVRVFDITIRNSPKFHLKFDKSTRILVHNIKISSPGTSPNTDGIHLQDCQDVLIQNSKISCGDDCVSIQSDSTNIAVRDTSCGPGHGISIGGLGKHNSIACVNNIVVDNIVMFNTTNGARIKTWQGGRGALQNVVFSNIQVNNVKVPIIIDQFYCDKEICKNQTDTVAINNVHFDQIVGTYTKQPFHIACSASVPCTDVTLTSIQLLPSPCFGKAKDGICSNSYGFAGEPLLPPSLKSCLISGPAIPPPLSENYC